MLCSNMILSFKHDLAEIAKIAKEMPGWCGIVAIFRVPDGTAKFYIDKDGRVDSLRGVISPAIFISTADANNYVKSSKRTKHVGPGMWEAAFWYDESCWDKPLKKYRSMEHRFPGSPKN